MTENFPMRNFHVKVRKVSIHNPVCLLNYYYLNPYLCPLECCIFRGHRDNYVRYGFTNLYKIPKGKIISQEMSPVTFLP